LKKVSKFGIWGIYRSANGNGKSCSMVYNTFLGIISPVLLGKANLDWRSFTDRFRATVWGSPNLGRWE
jgi:hypothetical protein